MRGRRVAVVGTCAAGKSSIVAGLRERGVDAFSVAQEHSIVANLWNHQSPEFLVVLQTTLETVRARRADPDWPAWLFERQQARLRDACEHADIIIATDELSVAQVVEMIVKALRE